MRLARFAATAFLCLWALLVTAPACADVQPKTYLSPSGEFALAINPGKRSGAGAGDYRLTRNGQPVWSAQQPFTFLDAVVTDYGTVAGHTVDGRDICDCGDFIVAIFDPKGHLLLTEKTPRQPSRFIDIDGDPKVFGQFVDPANNRYVVRIGDPDVNVGTESWWVYQLIDGKATGKFKPKELMPVDADVKYAVVDARPVAGTPLTLVHWYRYDGGCEATSKPPHYGARFTLVDEQYKPVWNLDLPDDYMIPGHEKAQDELRDEMRERSAILDSSLPHRFALRHVATQSRVEYSIEPDAKHRGRWTVAETMRAPYIEPSPIASGDHAAPQVELRKLGTINLGGASSSARKSPIESVREFAIDDRGRFGVLSDVDCEGGRAATFVLVDGAGRRLREVPMPPAQVLCAMQYHATWIGGDRWIITINTLGDEPTATAAWLDVANGKMTAIAGFNVQDVKALAASRDGGFVALTTAHTRYTMTDELLAFDAAGKLRWRLREECCNDESKFSEGEDVAVTSAGEIVILEDVAKKLKIYRLDGTYRGTIDLAQKWGREPNYPTALRPDNANGVIVYDFKGAPPIMRMTIDGTVTASFDPVYADARKFDINNVQMARDGALWTSDGHALLHLNAHGVVDRVLGDKPDAKSLGNVATMVVTAKGRIYAADQRTGAVHVFDEHGRRLQVCQPDPKDYDRELVLPSLSISDSRDVFITHREGVTAEKPDFLHYSADCKRLGVVKVELSENIQHWYSQPGTAQRWIVGYTNLYLVDSAGNVLRTVERTADGNWLEMPGRAGVAPDGSIAIGSGGIWTKSVTIYSPIAEPLVTWPVPDDFPRWGGAVAFDGERIAFLAYSGQQLPEPVAVAVHDIHGKPLFRHALATGNETMQVFLVHPRDEPELWIFDGKASITRYALPR